MALQCTPGCMSCTSLLFKPRPGRARPELPPAVEASPPAAAPPPPTLLGALYNMGFSQGRGAAAGAGQANKGGLTPVESRLQDVETPLGSQASQRSSRSRVTDVHGMEISSPLRRRRGGRHHTDLSSLKPQFGDVAVDWRDAWSPTAGSHRGRGREAVLDPSPGKRRGLADEEHLRTWLEGGGFSPRRSSTLEVADSLLQPATAPLSNHAALVAAAAPLGAALGKQAVEVSHVAAKYALDASYTIGQHALVRGADAGVFLGGQAHTLAQRAYPLLADAADGARHLAVEAASSSFTKLKGCLVHEETASDVESEGGEEGQHQAGARLLGTHPYGAALLDGRRLQRVASLGGRASGISVVQVQAAQPVHYLPSVVPAGSGSSSTLQQRPSFVASVLPPSLQGRASAMRLEGTPQAVLQPQQQLLRRAPSMVVQGASTATHGGVAGLLPHASAALPPARVLSIDRVVVRGDRR